MGDFNTSGYTAAEGRAGIGDRGLGRQNAVVVQFELHHYPKCHRIGICGIPPLRKGRAKMGHPAIYAGAEGRLFFAMLLRGPEGPLFHGGEGGWELFADVKNLPRGLKPTVIRGIEPQRWKRCATQKQRPQGPKPRSMF
jgi:hypothetical protein